MRQEDFLKKVEMFARYLNQYLDEGNIAGILEAIEDLAEIRKQAQTEGMSRAPLEE